MGNTGAYVVVMICYFLALLVIGIVFSKRAVKTEQDYFVAKDKLNAATIGFSFSATQMSGSTYMGTIGTIRGMGYAFVPAALSSAAAPWFGYILLGDRVRKVATRLKSVTLTDIIRNRFGNGAGLYATILMVICLIPLIAGQLKAAGNSFQVILGMPYLVAVVLFGGIVLIYTLLGGMFAVAWTDLIQGILMILGIVIMVPLCVSAAGGFTQMHIAYEQFLPGGTALNGTQPIMWVISGFVVWGFYQIGGNPSAMTRFLTTSDDKTMKKALAYSIVFESIIFMGVSILAVASPMIVAEVPSSDMTLPLMIQKLLHPAVGGVVLAAAMGAMMSTVDSVLLVISSLIVNDIYVKRMGKDANSKGALVISRVAIIVAACLAFLIAIDPPDAILWIITTGFSVMAAAFTFTLLLGLWWPGATPAGGMAGMIVGTVVAIFWYVLGFVKYGSLSQWVGGIWPAVIGSIASLIAIIVVSKASKPTDNEVLQLFFDETTEAI